MALQILKKFGDRLLVAAGLILFVPIFLMSVCALGGLILALPVWIVSLFSQHFATSISHLLLPDWLLHLGLIIPTAVGGISILCGSRISHALKRKQAIEEEINDIFSRILSDARGIHGRRHSEDYSSASR